jgi:hypothetical protein
LKQGDALLPFPFICASDYVIRKVQVNQDGMKLNGTHQLLVYAVEVHTLGGSIHTIKKNAEALVDSKEIGPEENGDKTKYIVMSRDLDAGQSHSLEIGNSSLERAKDFRYMGTTITNQNSIQEEIKSKLKSGNACYHLAQNLLSSCLLSKSLMINRLPLLFKALLHGQKGRVFF